MTTHARTGDWVVEFEGDVPLRMRWQPLDLDFTDPAGFYCCGRRFLRDEYDQHRYEKHMGYYEKLAEDRRRFAAGVSHSVGQEDEA